MVLFILILSLLILIHESGHFWVAKRQGIRVEKFSLGFGPRLLSKKIGDTEYMLCLIPFGGFVKMAGDSKEDYKGAQDEFLSKSPGKRAQIIFAGPLFNYILAFFCLWMVFYLGYPRFSSRIGELMPGYPAQKAGLQVEDEIIAVDGEPVQFWEDMTRRIHQKKGQDVRLGVRRGGEVFELLLTPEAKEVESVWGKKVEVGLIGVKPSDEIIKVRYGFWESLLKGAANLFSMTVMTLQALFMIIVGTMSFKDSMTGPIGIFFITSNAAKIGFSSILHVIGILSMSLAIFNVLPLPILDGGHIFLAGLEKLRGKPLGRKVEDAVSNVGMAFLIVLAVFIFSNDLIRYGYWDKFMSVFQK